MSSDEMLAKKDEFFGHNVVSDPYPKLAELASQCPVHPGTYSSFFDMVGAEDSGHPDVTRATNAHFLGIRDREWIVQQLPNYTALVFPGRVLEGVYPLVVREALESGVPVVSLSGSSTADLVQEADDDEEFYETAAKQVAKFVDSGL